MKFGTVSQIDPVGHRARVEFPAEDAEMIADEKGLESYWLPILCQWSTGSKSFCMPILGEQVVCWMDENSEFGVILGGIYSDADAPPGAPEQSRYQVYADGTILKYDPVAHALFADVKGTVEVKATGSASVGASNIVLKGATTVQGSLHVTQSATFDTTINATGEITSGSIPLTTHKHIGVTPGSGVSGTPTP